MTQTKVAESQSVVTGDEACIVLKVMRKEKVLEKEHGEYVKAESEILKTVLHPYIVALRYSFQAIGPC